MYTEAEKFYINCPYSEKEACKALGGKWDGRAKSWYVPAGISKRRFVRWAQIRARHVHDGKKNNTQDFNRRITASAMGALIRPNELAKLFGSNIKDAMEMISESNGPVSQFIGTTRYWKRDEILNWLVAEGL